MDILAIEREQTRQYAQEEVETWFKHCAMCPDDWQLMWRTLSDIRLLRMGQTLWKLPPEHLGRESPSPESYTASVLSQIPMENETPPSSPTTQATETDESTPEAADGRTDYQVNMPHRYTSSTPELEMDSHIYDQRSLRHPVHSTRHARTTTQPKTISKKSIPREYNTRHRSGVRKSSRVEKSIRGSSGVKKITSQKSRSLPQIKQGKPYMRRDGPITRSRANP